MNTHPFLKNRKTKAAQKFMGSTLGLCLFLSFGFANAIATAQLHDARAIIRACVAVFAQLTNAIVVTTGEVEFK